MRTLFVLFALIVTVSGIPLQGSAALHVEQIFSEPASFPSTPRSSSETLTRPTRPNSSTVARKPVSVSSPNKPFWSS
ncbi:hypothetical protein L596_023057 [Steinernema carpocapsae]|uniref:Uncharacterized protein n=1 Tax=Steinernema carpocapsae TaxID=34508 RepID=A0A4U5MCG9_STECR|nr:hypothetical protein L596_023057 [Steinernema carpocapsae]